MILQVADELVFEIPEREAEAFAELERARREFMQIASHELRTPLTVIRGYASLLEEGSLCAMPEQARQAPRTLMAKSSEVRGLLARLHLPAGVEVACGLM